MAYNALLPTSQITFTIWDNAGTGRAIPVGGSTMRLFSPKRYVEQWWNDVDVVRTLRRGQQRLLMHAGKEADPAWETATPSEYSGVQDEMGRLEEVSRAGPSRCAGVER